VVWTAGTASAMSTRHPAADFPIAPPIEPMLARPADALPGAGAFLYEPKWNGFRAIVSTLSELSGAEMRASAVGRTE